MSYIVMDSATVIGHCDRYIEGCEQRRHARRMKLAQELAEERDGLFGKKIGLERAIEMLENKSAPWDYDMRSRFLSNSSDNERSAINLRKLAQNSHEVHVSDKHAFIFN